MSINDTNQIPVFSSRDILAKYDIDSKISSYLDQVLLFNQKVNIVSRETSRPIAEKSELKAITVPFER